MNLQVYFDPSVPCKELGEANTSNDILEKVPKVMDFAQWLIDYKPRVPTVPKKEMYHESYQIMKPEIKKMVELEQFIQQISKFFCSSIEAISSITPADSQYGPLRCKLIHIVDIVVVLNFFKMFNPALMNDYSMFKRCFQLIKNDLSNDEIDLIAQQLQTLNLFLANPHSFVDILKSFDSKQQNKYENGLVCIFNSCVSALSFQNEVTDAEYCRYLRVELYSIYIIDGKNCNFYKSRSLSSAKQSLKRFTVVSVSGDKKLDPLLVLRSTLNWNINVEKDWNSEDEMINCRCL
eukprot:c18568_g1_i1.p1 GENE.c18568_g1_i1~~c18568_g1_i1.p1  ORF type:complete len:292 (-),score=78.63 c18568_g1_i1:20-895(-)